MKKKMLSIIMLLMMLTLIALVAGCTGKDTPAEKENATDNTQKEPITFRIAHVTSEKNVYHDAVVDFVNRVEEKSGGSIKFNIFPGAQLGGDRDMLEAIQAGTLDMGYISLAVFENITPVFTGLQLPFLIDNYETGYKAAASETAEKMLATLEEQNIKGLAIVQNGMRVVGNNVRPITKPEDFEGLKIRTAEGKLMVSMIKGLSALPTPMPYPEIYTALQTGVIDGQEQYAMTWVTDKFMEVIDYITFLDMYEWYAIFTMNRDAFESLSEEQQNILVEAAKETQKFMYESMEQYDKRALSEFQKRGIQVELSEDIDREAFSNKLKYIHEEYAEKHPLIKEMIQTVSEIKGD